MIECTRHEPRGGQCDHSLVIIIGPHIVRCQYGGHRHGHGAGTHKQSRHQRHKKIEGPAIGIIAPEIYVTIH